jgi:hypothetical protein
MLVTAVQFEAMNIGNRSSGKDKVAPMTHLDDDDIEFLDAQRTALVGSFQQSATATTTTNASKKSTTSNNTKTQEEFTMALLRELPQLLVTFKSETSILQSLTLLPQYFCTFLPDLYHIISCTFSTKFFTWYCFHFAQYRVFSTYPVERRMYKHCCQTYQ